MIHTEGIFGSINCHVNRLDHRMTLVFRLTIQRTGKENVYKTDCYLYRTRLAE